jgi:hypothetical protein
MAELPFASVTIDDEAGAFSGSTGFIVVLGCVGQNADSTPRVFSSTKALLAQHGYAPAVDYCAMHFQETKKPVIFVGLPAATVGTVDDDDSGVVGTSVVTAAAGPNGVLEELDGKLTVVQGGTVGDDMISFDLTIDGGRTTKRVRLGTANSYTIPYVGVTLGFAAGTLVAGDVFTFTTTAPMWDVDGLAAARLALAAQLKQARSFMVVGDLPSAAFAGYVTAAVNAYQTENDRFVYARAQVRDRDPAEEATMAAYVAAMDAEFASVDAQLRIDLGLGRGRKVSPVTGWAFRRPVQWAASLREYQHDLHIPCWRKSDGPVDGWDLQDADGNTVEYDERTDGGALMARFTCFRSYSNGPRGAFVALSLTRADEGSLLSRTHNMAVTNLACTIAQLETENAIGQVLVLNDDGTGTDASLALIEERVNSSLQIGLLQDKGEGQRASKAVWQASRSDVLNVPGAQLNGVLTLLLNGTLEKISTAVKIQTAG